jgi:hypothetical protein
MKKIVVVILACLALALPACSAENANTVALAAVAQTVATETVASTSFASSARLNADYDGAASVELQLVVGTLKLAGTELAITTEQAAVLLPLWSQVQTLAQNMGPGQASSATDADTQSQVDALLEQIQAAMTDEQIQYIADLQITSESAQTIETELGITLGGGPMAGGQSGGQNATNNTSPQGQPPSDAQQGQQGQAPSGNGGQPGSQIPSGGQAPQGQAPSGNGNQAGGMMPPQLIQAVIAALQEISGVQASTGTQGAMGMQAPGDSSASSSVSLTGAYTLATGSETQAGQAYTSGTDDQSAILVTNDAALRLSNATVTTSGNTSSNDSSSFYGLNAAVLAANGGAIDMTDSTITTTGSGANGAFSTGSGSTVDLSSVTIDASGDGAHGVMATQGGALTMTDVDITTAGGSSSAVATDRGGGTIIVVGGKVATSGGNSAGIYSTGAISVTGGTFTSTGAEAAVIEGANSIILNDTAMLSSFAGKWGVMIYQSFSGDAQGSRGTFSATGGSLTYTPTDGPLFYVTNSTGVINLSGVALSTGSGILVRAAAGNWGNSGSNGGTVLLTADGQILTGDMLADDISAITITLQNGSTLTGGLNAAHTAQAMNLALDAGSTWTVTADSYLTCLTDASGISGTSITNIIGNGHTVYYDASACPALSGGTYTLTSGGTLTPVQ